MKARIFGMGVLFCAVVFVLSFYGCGGGGGSTPVTPSKAYKIADYFPLNQGDEHYYLVITGTTTLTQKSTTSGTETVSGINTIKVTTIVSDDESYITWWALDTEGLRIVKGYEKHFNGETTQMYSPPGKYTPAEFDVGDQWTSEGTTTCSGNCDSSGSYSVTMQVMGVEDVTVKAGMFKNTIKIKQSQGTTISYYWFAKGVGKVKEIWKSGTTEEEPGELTYAKVAGTEYGTK